MIYIQAEVVYQLQRICCSCCKTWVTETTQIANSNKTLSGLSFDMRRSLLYKHKANIWLAEPEGSLLRYVFCHDNWLPTIGTRNYSLMTWQLTCQYVILRWYAHNQNQTHKIIRIFFINNDLVLHVGFIINPTKINALFPTIIYQQFCEGNQYHMQFYLSKRGSTAQCHYNAVNFLKTPQSSHTSPVRPRNGMSAVSLKSSSFSATVIAVLCVIS